MRQSGDYRASARGFASGTPDGLTAWLINSSRGILYAGKENDALIMARRAAAALQRTMERALVAKGVI